MCLNLCAAKVLLFYDIRKRLSVFSKKKRPEEGRFLHIEHLVRLVVDFDDVAGLEDERRGVFVSG